jgi:hypothetical protein
MRRSQNFQSLGMLSVRGIPNGRCQLFCRISGRSTQKGIGWRYHDLTTRRRARQIRSQSINVILSYLGSLVASPEYAAGFQIPLGRPNSDPVLCTAVHTVNGPARNDEGRRASAIKRGRDSLIGLSSFRIPTAESRPPVRTVYLARSVRKLSISQLNSGGTIRIRAKYEAAICCRAFSRRPSSCRCGSRAAVSGRCHCSY